MRVVRWLNTRLARQWMSLRSLLRPRNETHVRHTPALQNALESSRWLIADKVVRLGLGVLLNVTLARAYGPDRFGDLAYVLTITAIVAPVLSLGLERVVVRDLARVVADERDIIRSALGLRLIGGVVSAVLAIALVILFRGWGGSAVLATIIAAGNLFLCNDVFEWWLQARERFRTIVFVRGAAFVCGALAKISLAMAGAPLEAIGVSILAEVVIVALLFLRVGLLSGLSVKPVRPWHRGALDLLRASCPLMIADLAIALTQRIDVVLLEQFWTTHQVGVFASAQRLAQAAYFLPVVVAQAVAPRMARCVSNEAALDLAKRTIEVLSVAGLAVSIVLVSSGNLVIRLLFGSQFAEAGSVLQLLGATNFFVFIGCAHSLYLVNRGYQHITLRLTWITATVGILINLALIPRMGAFGAALASVLGLGATTMCGVALFRESRPLFALNIRSLAAPIVVVKRIMHGEFHR